MTNTGPISREEMIDMFGESMPIEAVNLVWNAPGEKTLAEIRTELREIAAKKKAAPIINHREALELAHMKREESNLALCYIHAVDALDAIKGHVQAQPSALARAIVVTCDGILQQHTGP